MVNLVMKKKKKNKKRQKEEIISLKDLKKMQIELQKQMTKKRKVVLNISKN